MRPPAGTSPDPGRSRMGYEKRSRSSGGPLHRPGPHVGHHPNGGRPDRHPLPDLRPKVGGLMSSMPRCTVVSFGYGHGPAPEADVIIDLRELLHRPLPTALRTMDGHDTCIKHWVENTPGAWAGTHGAGARVRGILAEARHGNVQIASGCTGGRPGPAVAA